MESRLTNIQPALNKTKNRTVLYYIEKPAFPEENDANMTIMKIQIPFNISFYENGTNEGTIGTNDVSETLIYIVQK